MTEEEADLIIKEQDKSRDEILKSLKNLEVHFRELFELKTKRIVELEEEKCELLRIIQDKNDTMERLKEQIAEFSRELHSSNKEIVELKEENEKLSGRLSEAVEIIKEYVKISLTVPETRSMIDEVELFKKAQEFLSEVEE